MIIATLALNIAVLAAGALVLHRIRIAEASLRRLETRIRLLR